MDEMTIRALSAELEKLAGHLRDEPKQVLETLTALRGDMGDRLIYSPLEVRQAEVAALANAISLSTWELMLLYSAALQYENRQLEP